ncbi:lactate utilization protein [Chloroflexota bacterium]
MNQQIDKLAETMEWYKEELARKLIESLEKNNISGFYVGTGEEALEKLLGLIPTGSKVGHGGSLTLEQIGAIEALRKGNYDFMDRRRPGISEEEHHRLRKESLFADVFLMSTNALTMDGKLVNIDGIGNRLAALIFGPNKVIIIAGINKVVPDMDAAINRIKNYVAPIHARRGDRPLPCAKTGNCINCHAPERFCNALVTIEHQYQRNKDRITVIIVGEELGL